MKGDAYCHLIPHRCSGLVCSQESELDVPQKEMKPTNPVGQSILLDQKKYSANTDQVSLILNQHILPIHPLCCDCSRRITTEGRPSRSKVTGMEMTNITVCVALLLYMVVMLTVKKRMANNTAMTDTIMINCPLNGKRCLWQLPESWIGRHIFQ